MISSIASSLRDKRRIWAVLLIIIIASTFWTSSRYPALGNKASMGSEFSLQTPLGFEALINVEDKTSDLDRLVATTINWVDTNKKGMMFGLLFAAAFMSLFSVPGNSPRTGRLGSTIKGMGFGVPLGVCVNCVAPIAQGMHESGQRLETTLAAMFSSPGLNIVVLTMLFTLFPPYMAVIKIGATLLLILVFVPWLAHMNGDAAKPSGTLAKNNAYFQAQGNLLSTSGPGWVQSFLWLLATYAKNLLFIIKAALPLMLLAGLLGAMAITLLPWESLVDTLHNMSRTERIMMYFFLAAFGLFLPVPIAFDVMVCAGLLSAGVAPGEVMILLFTLGIFSVYSFSIIWKAISFRVAAQIVAILIPLGMTTGVIAHYYDRWEIEYKQAQLLEEFARAPYIGSSNTPDHNYISSEELQRSIDENRLAFNAVDAPLPRHLTLESSPFLQTGSEAANKFIRVPAKEIGFAEPAHKDAFQRYIIPFSQLGAIAAGDVHNDGWTDVLMGGTHGLSLYVNLGGERYAQQQLPVPNDLGMVGAIALVDLNGDGWLDVFYTTYRNGSYVIYNNAGHFEEASPVKIADGDYDMVMAIAFTDIDSDGDLDIVSGNYTSGIPALSHESSRNTILKNQDGEFTPALLDGAAGETLTILASDINGDRLTDLLVGNDFQEPDSYYLNQGAGQMKLVRRQDKLFPFTTRFTMSINSADVDNDLELELYSAQITGPLFEEDSRFRTISYTEICNNIPPGEWRGNCTEDMAFHEFANVTDWNARVDLSSCDALERGTSKWKDCAAIKLFRLSRQNKSDEFCEILKVDYPELSHMCSYLRKDATKYHPRKTDLVQKRSQNMLFDADASGTYVNLAKQKGLDIGGWSWNTRFADFDNDEWQDLYISAGWFTSKRRESNYYFSNERGQHFTDRTEELGLTDYMASTSFVTLDADNDGDLDIVGRAFNGPTRVYDNQLNTGNAVAIELRSPDRNHFAIGATVVIRYGESNNLSQMREVKASGGYLSIDQPVLWFGLGQHEKISAVEIYWPDGAVDQLDLQLAANHRYRLSRDD